MRFPFCLSLSLILFIACNSSKKEKNNDFGEQKIPRGDSTLLTDTSWGWVNSDDNIDSLKMMFGDNNIRDERICGPECADSVDVTFVFPNTVNAFTVYWNDSAYHKEIAFIRAYTAGSAYHTTDGIKLGSTLAQLLQVNGKPISFSGFGWDYGGGIQSFANGKLENSKVRFNLDLPENPTGDDSVYGDITLTSDMENVKKLIDKILVGEIFLSFSKN